MLLLPKKALKVPKIPFPESEIEPELGYRFSFGERVNLHCIDEYKTL